MPRMITVKGVGRASVKPDYVVLTMTLETKHRHYDQAMEWAAIHLQQINDSLCAVGFEKNSVKTTRFNVRTEYNRVKDHAGIFHNIFEGYVITHDLKVSFDLDMSVLAKTLSAIAECLAHPQLSIAFTVKDTAAISEEMLRSAAENARAQAEILCAASGAVLGKLLTIDYDWGEVNVYSRTRYECCDEGSASPMASPAMDIEPDDIDASDTVTFVWEIN